MKRILIILFLTFLATITLAQIDSLENLLKTAKEDTNKVKILNRLCWKLKYSNPEKAIEYVNQGLVLAKKINYTKGRILCLNNIGVVYMNKGNYNIVLDYWLQSLKISKEIGDKHGIAETLNDIGEVNRLLGNYATALNNYLQSLKISEELVQQAEQRRNYKIIGKCKQMIAGCLNNIGIIYFYQGEYIKVIDYFQQSLKKWEELGDKYEVAKGLDNIGVIHFNQGNYKKAIDYHKKSLKIKEELGDKRGIATSLNNLGEVNRLLGNYEIALSYQLQSLKMKEELGDKRGIANSFNDLGETYSAQGNYEKAVEYSNRSLIIAKEIETKELIKNAYDNLTKIYSKQYNYKKAFEYHQLFTQIKDSLFNEESLRQIVEMQTKYESEKKQKEIELLTKDKKIQELAMSQKEAEVKRQRVVIFSSVGGFILAIALSLLYYNRYKLKKKSNLQLKRKNESILRQKEEIEKRKKEIEEQKKIVEEKNKDITDSIEYASNIQQAILPKEQELNEILPDHFVLFQPRDIVSGDFYWFHSRVDLNLALLAVCDCTGHGVPGAFVSMIGNDLLNQTIIEKSEIHPGEILSLLNNGMKSVFIRKGTEQEAQDGMDMTLCVFSMDFKTLEFAGANNPLFIVRSLEPGKENIKNKNSDIKTRNSELIELKGDKTPIGGYTALNYKFTNHKIKLQKGDSIYMLSDGYPDQFGGLKNKKFMIKRFKQLIVDIHDKNMSEQKEFITTTIKKWIGENEQIDDILVIGVQV